MPTAVVTGANSGIGHAFAQVLIDQACVGIASKDCQQLTLWQGYEVHACDVNEGAQLQSLKAHLHRLDVRSPESIQGFAAQIAGKPVDVLLNVAGIMAPPAQDSLENIHQGILNALFEVNTFGPLLLTQALLPNLLASREHPARVGIVSSKVGSISDNSTGGAYAYRASKAAVNSIGKSLSCDLSDKGVVVSLLHPGYVNSNMTAGIPRNPAAVEPEEAARKLWIVMESHGKDMAETGKFWHREGFELPW